MITAKAAVTYGYPPKSVFTPLFMIFAAVALLIAGCNDDTIVEPGDGNGDIPDEPVCPLNTPWVDIVEPDAGDDPFYPPRFDFRWEQGPDYMIAFTRHFLTGIDPGTDGTAMLNEHPEEFEGLWSDWKQWDPEGETLAVGGETPLEDGSYLFAVQAMDSCGKVTDRFFEAYNTRQFTVNTMPPVLVVWEQFLGSGTFYGTSMRPPAAEVLPGIFFSFHWSAEPAYSWFGPVEFRYGWDIQNLEEDDEWATGWNPNVTASWPWTFAAGVHVFYVEARDDALNKTRARVEIEVIPYLKSRDLLWIDDWALGGFIPSMIIPSEEAHDTFWTSICSRAPGFDAVRDIYEADVYSLEEQPPLSVLAEYKNVIWTYSSSESSSWAATNVFYPWPQHVFPRPNNFRMFLAAGGNALTCGRTDRYGGLGSVFPDPPMYPASVLDDLTNFDYDMEYAKYSLAYDDYYVTVVDKVVGSWRTDMPEGVVRSLERDAMRMAYHSGSTEFSALPDTLTLSEEVTRPGMFFDPAERGFYYVEAYDPSYYMDYIMEYSHPCFTPLYRMKARSALSPLNDAVIAMRVMKGTDGWGYPRCEPGRDTPFDSYHFGIPLWFIDHGQAERIADFIFDQWDIK